jgi:16S rRNA (guanine966-N2)-methyltransferase
VRIISGTLKGRKLYPIKGMAIRPTSDRLRESVFNIISAYVRDSVVLDMFAGTGALGIEALSRGATFAVFLDKSKHALSVIEKNIRSFGLENRAKMILWDAAKNLNCIPPIFKNVNTDSPTEKKGFNLVFMDPPYNKNLIKPAICNLHTVGCLENDAMIVAEHSDLENIPQEYSGFAIADQRKYGKTLVSFLTYVIHE